MTPRHGIYRSGPLLCLALAATLSACEEGEPTGPGAAEAEPIGSSPVLDGPALGMLDPGYPDAVTVRRSTGAAFGGNEEWIVGKFVPQDIADVTGDGAADAVRFMYGQPMIVRPALPGSRSFGAPQTWANGALGGDYLADVDGDGKKDIIDRTSSGVWVSRSTGSGLQNRVQWLATDLASTKGTYFADIDGDRKADAIMVNTTSITARLSTGSSFGAAQAWSSVAYSGNVTGFWNYPTYFADVTGDGRADAIAVTTGGVMVRPAVTRTDTTIVYVPPKNLPQKVAVTRKEFGTAANWTGIAYHGDPSVSTHAVYFADVNSDKKADAIVVNPSGVTVRRSTGSSFSGNESWTSSPYYGHTCNNNNYFVDVTGEGSADALVINESAAGCPEIN